MVQIYHHQRLYVWRPSSRLSPFRNRLWQRNDRDRIIRADQELDRIRTYIAENPARWDQDADTPSYHSG